MDKEEFKKRMETIFQEDSRPAVVVAHEKADDLMVEALESLGYDLSDFKNAERWYD